MKSISKSALGVTLLTRLAELIPQLTYLPNFVSEQFSLISNRLNSDVTVSYGVIGLECWLFMILLTLFAFSNFKNRFVKFFAVLWLIFPLVGILFIGPHSDNSLLFFSTGVSLTWLVSIVISVCLVLYGTRNGEPLRAASTSFRTLIAAGSIAMLLGFTLGNFDTCFAEPNRNIVVHNRGGLDWKRSTYKNFYGGMFGQLPLYTQANGFDFQIIDRDEISSADLEEKQILILINSGQEWGDSKTVILNFVDSGGSLLILGDHTDVFGLMKSFNELLFDTGVKFNFDSAYNARESWKGCLSSGSGPLEANWESGSPGIGVGASLKISGFARPLLSGRFGFSDIGVRENVMGSYLGNYDIDPGEKLGDLPIVAQINQGKGRIIVYGDTSSFQGSISKQTEQTIIPLFEFLSRPPGFTERNWVRGLVGLLLIFFVATLLFLPHKVEVTFIATMLASLGLASCLGDYCLRPAISFDKSTVLIGDCQFNNTGHYDMGVNSIGSLYSAIHRSGFRTHFLKSWDREKLFKTRAVCFVAPQKEFEPNQVDDLLDFESGGGITIVASGYDSLQAIRPLLARHDLTIQNRPMGTVKFSAKNDGENKKYPRLLDAWPIESLSELGLLERLDTDLLLEYGGEAAVIFCHKGNGGLVLIGDDRFFSSQNVERYPNFKWEGNVEFIKQIFALYLKSKPDEVSDVFPSPKKPD